MYKLGIDLGGTNIAVGVVDENYNIVSKLSTPTLLPDTSENIVARIVNVSRECISKIGLSFDDISAIGIGTPGAVNSEDGIVMFANNLGFNNVPLSKMLEKEFGQKVYCENDANAAAYGEYLVSDSKEDTLVAITIGTGIGGGVIIDGKLYSGNNYSGGELGHMVINFDGIPCSCGRRGCYEAYASATALIRQTKVAMTTNPNSKMWQVCDGDIEKVTGKTVFDALRLGDDSAYSVVEQYADYVSIGLVDIINTFGPATICISGGISKEGESLLEPIRRHIKLNKPVNCHTTVCVAKLNNDAGIIGASNLDTMSSR